MTFGFNTGLKALTASRLGIQTAGHNVANANTPGYSRQRVMYSSALPFAFGNSLQIGSGVDIDEVSRIVDRSLITRLSAQAGVIAGSEHHYQRLAEIENAFGEPDNGLSNQLAGLLGSISSLQADPADRALRGGAVQSAGSLADAFNLLSSRLDTLDRDTTQEVTGLVQELNRKADRVAALNAQISEIEAAGAAANDLRDRRDVLVQEISELGDVRTLERGAGSLDILLGGHLLVSGNRSKPVEVRVNDAGKPAVFGPTNEIELSSGRIGAILDGTDANLSRARAEIDRAARSIVLEFNRAHSTGIPASGPFQSLTSELGVVDSDGDGTRGDEFLSSASLPFEIQSGELFVNVTNRTTGRIERTRIEIDPRAMSLNDLASELDSIENLSSIVDPAGRLQIQASSGHGFDFSSRLDEYPDEFGSFGGTSPVRGTAGAEPFDLSGAAFPQSFVVDVNGSNETVTLEAADFDDPASATAEELANAISADLGSATADAVGGRVVIRSDASGSASSLNIVDGSGAPLAALGIPTGVSNGQDTGVEIRLSGDYTGESNDEFNFIPDGDGTIGVTSGLTVGVFNESGQRIGTLNVGSDYDGGEIEIADGLSVKFSQGEISATDNQVASASVLADSDTSDVLAVLGINTMFSGDSAETIAVASTLRDNPENFATALSGSPGDNGNLRRLGAIRDGDFADLDDRSIEAFYAGLITEVGFETAAARDTVDAEQSLMTSLQNQRDSVSAVNIDEEMVDLVRHQQAYEAAARYISTIQEMTSVLINIGR